MPPRPTLLAQSLPASVPFVGPETQERARGRAFVARLGANESVFGPSPDAIAAMAAAASEVWMYGDPEVHDLRAALARHHDVAPENIVVGEGIDGLLGYLVRLMIAPGDNVVTSDGAYPTFNFHVTGYGGHLHKAPYHDDHEDPDALLKLARNTRAKLIYLANPDNPMGTWHTAARLEAMVTDLPPDCLLILDEAYIDLAPPGTAPAIPADQPQAIRLRTFSKGYGMAGLRVGYGIAAPEWVSAFNKVRNHFGVGRIAQAGALAALADQPYLTAVAVRVAQARDSIAAIGRANGLIPLPSATNFVALDCGADGMFAARVLTKLVDQGIFIRKPFVSPQDRCIRISAGTPADLAALAKALPLALRKAHAE